MWEGYVTQGRRRFLFQFLFCFRGASKGGLVMMVALNEIMGSEASQTTFNDREARYEVNFSILTRLDVIDVTR